MESASSLFASLVPPDKDRPSRFLWINNYDAERYWTNRNTVQLPKISQPEEVVIVNRMEEMGLLLAAQSDYLLLREPSDPAFLNYLEEIGFKLPAVLTVDPPDKLTPISEAILSDDTICGRLKELSTAQENCVLMPYAMTPLEEEIQRRTGLRSIWPPAAVCAKINSKIYSREISRELGLRTIDGFECESVEALTAAYQKLTAEPSSKRAVVLKEAMGVSGKGIAMIEDPARFDGLLRVLKRKMNADAEISFVLEAWIDKAKDINYQIFITPAGEVRVLSIKEILTDRGAHLGHRFPARLTGEQLDCYSEAAEKIGRRLFNDGFFGLAGVDSIIDQDGGVYPMLEINARLNMSSYQLNIDKLIPPEAQALAKRYKLTLEKPISFDALRDFMGPDLFKPYLKKRGVLFQSFAGVNVNYDPGSRNPFKGRLYALLVGENEQELERLDRTLSTVLAKMGAKSLMAEAPSSV